MTWNACWNTIGTSAGSRTVTAHFVTGLAIDLDVDRLEILLVELGARRLAGDAEDRNRIRRGGVEPGDHVGAGGTGRADADADIARLGARVAVRHVRCALDMAGENVADGAALAQRRVERVDCGAWHAESDRHALALEHQHRRVDRSHLGHDLCPPILFIAERLEIGFCGSCIEPLCLEAEGRDLSRADSNHSAVE